MNIFQTTYFIASSPNLGSYGISIYATYISSLIVPELHIVCIGCALTIIGKISYTGIEDEEVSVENGSGVHE